MKIAFAETGLPKSGAVVVLVEKDKKFSPAARDLDAQTGGALSRAIAASRFAGKKAQFLEIVAPASPPLDRILLAGIGDKFDELAQLALGGGVFGRLGKSGSVEATVILDTGADDLTSSAATVAQGARLAAYRFDKYRTKEEKDDKPVLKSLTVAVTGAAKAKKAYQPLDKIVDGVIFTRDLVSEPPNVIYPESLAQQAKTLESLGVAVEIFDEAKMAELGMGALLGVGLGSERETRMVVMHWNGAAKPDEQPIAFVGKGVTFDTGGISLKPGPGMEEMKWDMGGAGTVIGLMKALAGRKAKANVVGLVGLVENMPDGKAQRPGDIVTSMSGQTIEIHNTDAEGRLVLADVLWYCQDRIKPSFIVDLATLTGAIIVSLAHEYAGLFSNNDELSERLFAAGTATGEKVWRLPLGDAYDKMIKSDAADMKNIGGKGAGSITAAQFLQRFVNKTPWAHLDIAGMAWTKEGAAITPKGATGFGVRLLDRLVAEHYEK